MAATKAKSYPPGTVLTNDLKKGDTVYLRNGWKADIADNMKGNTRVCKVYGFETELGSVYSHDILRVLRNGVYVLVTHTHSQLDLMQKVRKWGM